MLSLVQEERFGEELKLLEGRNMSTRLQLTGSNIKCLSPFKSGGLLRVGGRLKYAPLPFDTKHPIILPNDHFVTRLIIKYYHETNGHVGALHTLSSLRERFWIIRGHSTVKKVIRECFHCRRWYSKPVEQLMASIPDERMMAYEPPFTAVGIDYFGPFLVKRGRSTEKRYGCIFTCLTIRAVHLEVAHSLDMDSFLLTFLRFVARRRCPKIVYSDNGTNFRGAESIVRQCLQAWNQDKIIRTLGDKGCKWKFIPPKASHCGGIW